MQYSSELKSWAAVLRPRKWPPKAILQLEAEGNDKADGPAGQLYGAHAFAAVRPDPNMSLDFIKSYVLQITALIISRHKLDLFPLVILIRGL